MDDEFPPGCSCERIPADTGRDVPGTVFIRGRSDPPCRVHLTAERAIYDAGYRRGYDAGRERGYADGFARGSLEGSTDGE